MAHDIAWPRFLQNDRPGSTLGIALGTAIASGVLGMVGEPLPPGGEQAVGLVAYATFVLGLALLVPWAMLVLTTPPPTVAARVLRLTAGVFLAIVAGPLALLGIAYSSEDGELLPHLLALNVTLVAMAAVLIASCLRRGKKAQAAKPEAAKVTF
jgi:hypothetical protein